LLTPELALTGYPPEDLLLRPAFVEQQERALAQLCDELRSCPGLHVVVGHVHRHRGELFNAASVLTEGRIIATYHKRELPAYGVFDERRYFQAGTEAVVFEVGGLRFGLNICEDAWLEPAPRGAAGLGAQILLVLNASPYCVDKQAQRE